jgi:hypothetical protein
MYICYPVLENKTVQKKKNREQLADSVEELGHNPRHVFSFFLQVRNTLSLV